MTPTLFDKLKTLAKPFYEQEDPSHDWGHIMRVLSYAQNIHQKEGGDWEVIAAGVLFHDCVNYPKNDPRSKLSAEHSAQKAREVLESVDEFPQEKLADVMTCVEQHSYSRGVTPTLLEAKIVQDADRLESTGIISLMRTFSSGGVMNKKFFDFDDPFCENREPDCNRYSLDLAFARLLKVSQKLNTASAKSIAIAHDARIHSFLALFKEEVDLLKSSEHFCETVETN